MAAPGFSDITAIPASVLAQPTNVSLTDMRAVNVDTALLKSVLKDAPHQTIGAAVQDSIIVSLPTPDGKAARFKVWEVSITEPGYVTLNPDMKMYRGRGIDDPYASLAADIGSQGFHASVRSPNGGWYVDPYYHQSQSVYAVYDRADVINDHGGGCGCGECLGAATGVTFDSAGKPTKGDTVGVVIESPEPSGGNTKHLFDTGTNIRRLRMALAATSEYTAIHGGTKAKAEADMKTTLERVNQIYLSELAVEFVLVANNISLIYNEPDVDDDPYTSGNKATMLDENHDNITSVIQTPNFDIGHVFDGTSIGGQANPIGNVGNDNKKGRGVSTSTATSPTDLGFIQLVTHEIGHQMGAFHTFNGADATLTANWEGGTSAYEPGEGSTYMSYATAAAIVANVIPGGIEDYFHIASLNDMTNRLAAIPNVGTKIATGNTTPNVSVGGPYTIPARTPFILTGSGSDPDNHGVSFVWEQFDKGTAPTVMGTDSNNNPLFRSIMPNANGNVRSFPNLATVLTGTTGNPAETPTTTARTMNFRLTVRDYPTTVAGGFYRSAETQVHTKDTGSGFAITNFNAYTEAFAGKVQTVTWDVAGTTTNGINESQVFIDLSTDGGYTFSNTIATFNDGSAEFTLPTNIATNNARFRIRPVGNIFYDITNADFKISIPTTLEVSNDNDFGQGSLRQAILDSNLYTNMQTINFTSFFNVPRTISLALGEMSISDAVTLNGPGSSLLTINGNSSSRHFNTAAAPASSSVAIRRLTLTNGKATDGGSINVADESLNVEDCVITSNSASEDGGAINVQNAGSLILIRSTVSGNVANDDGGGIYFNVGGSAILSQSAIVNNTALAGMGGGLYFCGTAGNVRAQASTITGNVAGVGGGGVMLYNFTGDFIAQSSTITGNSTKNSIGGGIARAGSGTGSISLTSTIVSGNLAFDIFSSGTVNVNSSAIGDTGGFTLTGSNNIIGQNLKLRPIANNGGSTPTIAFEFDSPLRDVGLSGFLSDQRGLPSSNNGFDIGAFELQTTVTNTSNSGAGSLRDAIAESNRVVGSDTIDFDQSFTIPRLISLSSGELAINDAVTINGRGATLTTVSGNGISRIYNTSATPAGKTVTLRGLTLTAGSAVGSGGAIITDDEHLVVGDSVISNSSASSDGGGIHVGSGGKLSLSRSTLVGNSAVTVGGAIRFVSGGNSELIDSSLIGNKASDGGAIFLTGQGSTLTVLNSTVSGNSVTFDGGGISAASFIGALTIRNSTITANTAAGGGGAAGGGLHSSGGAPNIHIESTIISGNTAPSGADISSPATLTINRSAIGFVGGFTFTGSNNLPFGTNLKLGSLANNGGPTLSHLPANGSPLINAGSNPAVLPFDQRGFNRTLMGGIDIGSVETSLAPPDTTAPTITSITSTTGNGTYGVGTPINVNVILSEFVTLTGTLNVTLDTGAVLSISGPQTGQNFNATYTVAPGQNSPDLNVTSLALTGGSTVHDAAGNNALFTLPSINLAVSKDIVISTPPTDTNAPTITSITSPTNGTFQAGAPITVSLIFSELVTLNGGGYLFVFFDSGGSMLIQGPQTASTLTGTYTVGSNQNSADLNVTGVTLDSNSSLLDAAGNAAVLTLPTNNLAVTKDIVVGTPVAKTFTVKNTNDFGADSLRQAVDDANASPGFDVITFDASFNTPQTITLGTQLNINEAVAINGRGAHLTTIQGSGSNRLILTQNALTGAVINISGLTLSGGRAGNGAGIFIGDETVNISNSVLSNNSTSGLGGAITVQTGGKVTLLASTLSGNTASFGGGVSIFSGSADIQDSSIINNTATNNQGGGLYFGGTVGSGGLRLLNSTVSGNKAGTYGGGVGLRSFNGKFEAINSTITNNTSSYLGGGISRNDSGTGTIFLRSTIISGNSATVGGHDLYSTTTVDAFWCAVGKSGGFTLTTSNGFNLDYGTDLKLGALAANGGPTLTHRPAGDSPLLNAGTNYYNITNDQRGIGFPRLLNGTPDIGAVEVAVVASTMVTNINDTGAGSLRQAILNANSNAGADTVSFEPTFFATPRTITLGGTQLAITDTTGKTTIAGPGVSLLTICGNNASRVLQVNSSVSVDIGGVTIAGGKSTDGGGIMNSGTLTIANAKISGNTATNLGGGIYNGGYLSLDNATIDGNAAYLGAGMQSNGTLLVNNSIFNNNTSSYIGGGIRMFGTATIANTTLTNNSAAHVGGGLINHAITTFSNVTVANNTASYGGGGIYNFQTTATISDSKFTGNKAGYGGAIFNHDPTSTINISKSIFSQNTAVTGDASDGSGGAIWSNGPLTITNSTLSNNSAKYGGGAISNCNTLTLSNSTIASNTAVAGGGILAIGTVTVNDSYFSNNKANYGGAIKNDATFNISNSTFDMNTAMTGDGQGGGIWNNAPMTMDQCTFTANHSIYGGAVFSPSGANIASSIFTNNVADINGGAMWLLNVSAIAGSTFNNNFAGNGGGALFSHGDTTISNSTIANNSALSGGGIQFYEGSGTMQNVTAAYNSASAYGGGLAVNTAIVTATNAVVAGNTAPDQANVWGTLHASSSNNSLNLTASAAGLRTLAYNGGLTQTIAFVHDSPLHNAGSNGTGLTVDQRGMSRNSGGVDIGAFELNTFVTNINDSGFGSLRDAIAESNRVVGLDTITFDSSFSGSKTIPLTTGVLSITDAVTINGPGTATTISGNNASRIFLTQDAPTSAAITINNLRLANGFGGTGGGIYASDEVLTLSNVILENNSGTGSGGGIFMAGSGAVRLFNSTVSGNSTPFAGGGVYFLNGGQFISEGSSFVNNTAGTAGGGFFLAGTAGIDSRIVNSTFSGNSGAIGSGITLANLSGTLPVINSTIVNNSASNNGGGIAQTGTGTVSILSSIVSGNTAPTAPDISASSSVTVNFSAIGNHSGFTLTGVNNLPAGSNLKLGTLVSNGGLTFTHLPAYDSPLINTGSNTANNTTDQRGLTRVVGGMADIGAVEVQNPIATSYTVNNGDTQRSRITTITVNFNGTVAAANYNILGAITLTRTQVSSIPTGLVGDVVQTGPAAAGHISVTQGTSTSLILTFDNSGSFTTANSLVQNGSLSNGYWRLAVESFQSALNDLNLRRLYGDGTLTAGGTVDGNDLTSFGNVFGTSNIAFDFNNDGTVDGNDLTVFGNNFGMTL